MTEKYCRGWRKVDWKRVYCTLEKGHDGPHKGFFYEDGSGAVYEVEWYDDGEPIVWDEEMKYEFKYYPLFQKYKKEGD